MPKRDDRRVAPTSPPDSPVSRQEALHKGLDYYFTGKPCKRGHIDWRNSARSECLSCRQLQKDKDYQKHRQHIDEKNARWAEENRAKHLQIKRNYYINNPEQAAASAKAMKARRRGAEGHFTKEDIDNLKEAQKMKCVACEVDLNESGYHVDHIVPIAAGGSNYPENLQLLCPSCNISKNSRPMHEWMQKKFGKLL